VPVIMATRKPVVKMENCILAWEEYGLEIV
jgi:hypothetical protein